MPQSSTTDIVGVCVLLASLIFSSSVAAVVGPYMVILIASTIGASFSLARRPKSTRGAALWYFARINGLAALLTVGMAAALAAYWPDVSERVLLAPIALLVGFVGDDWPKLLARVMRAVNAAIDHFRTGKGAP